ncbi:flagellar hook-associated protein 2 [Indiicoccus explosivorum]|uniref:flagellar hook-associated protein 2 n=1 Tax=Indiicoccus explosivorum TaxID=1917864 RepID=UPI000B450335|nr:flagellar hook-associated protein 2 [Indiicoccus explosivorum]
MRISGLASGIDTETMVKELMAAERIPLDKLNQKKTYLEWQRDDYREVNRNLKAFSDKLFDNLILQSTFIQKNVNISQPDAVSIRNVGSTSDFTGSIQVNRLASAATIIGTPTGMTAGELDSSEKLIPAGGTAQTVKIRAIKADGTMQTAEEAYTFTIKPGETTLKSLISDINSKSGVSTFYDSFTGKVSMTAKNSGDVAGGAEILLEGAIFDDLGLTGTAASVTAGVNAEFTYNGLTTERPSNTFQLNGFEVTLKAETTTAVNFSSSPATEKIFEKIKEFVDGYNKLIEDLNGKISERKNRDYPPLTTEQRKELSEEEVKLWDEQAKKGTLHRDPSISSGLNKLRQDLYTPVSGLPTAGDLLAEFGIKTSSSYSDNGKLIIDEAKLKEAISKDPNGLYQLFAADGTTDATKGIARRMRDTIDATIEGIEVRAGKPTSVGNSSYTIGRTMESLDSRIDSFEDRLRQVESRYWRQFTAMEKAIQQANSQSMALMNAFSGGQY